MTRKDYVLIANALHAARRQWDYEDEHGQRGVEDAATCIAYALAQDNPRFDTERFMAACRTGVKS